MRMELELSDSVQENSTGARGKAGKACRGRGVCRGRGRTRRAGDCFKVNWQQWVDGGWAWGWGQCRREG